jgi:histidinol-phosphatase (PHP family)
MKMIYKTDYHIHSHFSDGKSPPEDYIVPALQAGLKEIGFSEHLVLTDEQQDWSIKRTDVPVYLNNISNLRDNNIREIKVKTGIEIDYLPGKEEEIRTTLASLDLDYVIGSVHYLGESTVDLSPDFYRGRDMDSLFEQYFDRVCIAVETGLFDIIAHCDLIRIFGFKAARDPESLYRVLAKKMKLQNVAFELNTNGRNKPLADFYPDRRFLHIFREEEVPVCVNSDAHMPARVGQFFDEAYDLLEKAGYTEMAVFDNRRMTLLPFRCI